jgi:hypothetical protein
MNCKKCSNSVLMDGLCSRHLKQKCSICWEMVPSTNSARAKRLRCGHAFHLDCILDWFVECDPPRCPICRKEVVNDSLIKFKNSIEQRIRIKYRDAIRSLQKELREIRR